MNTIYEYICHGVRSLSGAYLRPYNRLWDEKLKWYLDGGEVLPKWNGCSYKYLTATITKGDKSIVVWVSHRFFTYGNLYQDNLPEYRPSIKTMLLLDKRCQAYIDMVDANKLREDNKSYEEL